MATRPILYSQEIADRICARLADGESLRKICEDADMPARLIVRRWLSDGAHAEFEAQYAQAREDQADHFAAEIIEIADDSSGDVIETENGPRPDPEFAARSRLRVDARKWAASKMAPRRYGDRQHIDVNDVTPRTDEEINARLAQLINKATSK